MKNFFILLFILISNISFGQKFEFGVSGGFNSSTHTLRTDGATQIGVSFNTIGNLQYQVDSYPGYHVKGIISVSKTFSDIWNIKFSSGAGYSSQGATLVTANKTRMTNNLNYIQVPLLITLSFRKLGFLFGPQINFLNDIKTSITKSTILSLNALANNNYFTFKDEDYQNRDNSFVFGVEYEVYKDLSASIKYLTSLKNISTVPGETWKNKNIEISLNYTLLSNIK